jgi:hypothetical protein
MTEFVSRKMSEKDSVPHTVVVGKLLGVVREYIRDCGETAVLRDHGEAKAVLGLM